MNETEYNRTICALAIIGALMGLLISAMAGRAFLRVALIDAENEIRRLHGERRLIAWVLSRAVATGPGSAESGGASKSPAPSPTED